MNPNSCLPAKHFTEMQIKVHVLQNKRVQISEIMMVLYFLLNKNYFFGFSSEVINILEMFVLWKSIVSAFMLVPLKI